jgi:hypothetical protein
MEGALDGAREIDGGLFDMACDTDGRFLTWLLLATWMGRWTGHWMGRWTGLAKFMVGLAWLVTQMGA